MGLLIPTPDDQAVTDQLDLRFNGGSLRDLYDWQRRNRGDQLFGPGPTRNLNRAAARLQIYPASARGKARWFLFLRRLPYRVQEAIKAALNDALNDAGCAGVTFGAVHRPVRDYEALIETAPVRAEDPRGPYRIFITLICPAPLSEAEAGDPEPPSDPGESPDRLPPKPPPRVSGPTQES